MLMGQQFISYLTRFHIVDHTATTTIFDLL